MRHRATQAFAKYQDWQLRRLRDDEAGLALVGYGLNVAFIVVPTAIALFFFDQQTFDRAHADLTSFLGASAP